MKTRKNTKNTKNKLGSKITTGDYKKILSFYKMRLPKKNKTLKEKAEKILGTKLCKCIKKVGLKNEPRSIAICSRSIFTRKGLRRGKFTCKKRARVDLS
jgi:hypothetical protein